MDSPAAGKFVSDLPSTRCPRCGYDQRGVIESWDDACPMEGTCPECGLEFGWPEILSTKLIPPRWCVEYGRWWTLPLRGLATMTMALWPARFFSSLKMSHRPRWRRLTGFLFFSFDLVLGTAALSHGYYGWCIWREYDKGIIDYNRNLPNWNAQIQRSGGTALPLASNSFSPVEVVLRYTFLPFSDKRPGWYLPRSKLTIVNGLGQARWSRIPSPREVLLTRYRVSRRPVPFLLIVIFPVLLQGLMPLGFIAMPWSRRIARVRWTHIVRISTYGLLLLLIPLLAVFFALPRVQAGWALAYQRILNQLGSVCMLLVPLMLLLWWRYAIRDHLRMPHSWGLAGSLLAMSMLLLLLCGYYDFAVNQWPEVYLFLTGQG